MCGRFPYLSAYICAQWSTLTCEMNMHILNQTLKAWVREGGGWWREGGTVVLAAQDELQNKCINEPGVILKKAQISPALSLSPTPFQE